MTDLLPELEAAGRELTSAFALLLERRRRRRRTLRLAAAVAGVFCAFTAVAFASGVGDDLQLDPTKWTIFDRGSVENGKAAYVKAHARDGGGDSTFIVEHDASMQRYDAFLLHEQAVRAGGDGEPGTLCTATELTKAETLALAKARSLFAPGTSAAAMKDAVDDSVRKAFADAPCRGLEYASEQARFVYSGVEPSSMLMRGAR